MNDKKLYQTKTFWVCVIGLISAISGYATGEMTIAQAVQVGLTAVTGVTIRDGILKK